MLGFGWVEGVAPVRVQAEPPNTAPVQLKNALTQIDAAANNRNLQAVMQFFSPGFTQSDGLTYRSLQQSLSQLWKRYPNLTYRTELESWKPEGRGFLAETVTYIQGSQKLGEREFKLEATMKSRQRFENQKILRQDVLSERSKVTSGANPPTVKFNVPEQVTVGQDFNFDVIVQEPLGNDLLLGTALEEASRPTGYLQPTKVDLELLPAGGIFKVGRAPLSPDSRWLSAVLVRESGMTMVTQRLRVVGRPKR